MHSIVAWPLDSGRVPVGPEIRAKLGWNPRAIDETRVQIVEIDSVREARFGCEVVARLPWQPCNRPDYHIYDTPSVSSGLYIQYDSPPDSFQEIGRDTPSLSVFRIAGNPKPSTSGHKSEFARTILSENLYPDPENL